MCVRPSSPVSDLGRPETHVTNVYWARDPNILQKISCTSYIKVMAQSSHNYAHATTAQLSWHLQNGDLNESLNSRLKLIVFSKDLNDVLIKPFSETVPGYAARSVSWDCHHRWRINAGLYIRILSDKLQISGARTGESWAFCEDRVSRHCPLTHLGLNEMVNILQTGFSTAFYQKKSLYFIAISSGMARRRTRGKPLSKPMMTESVDVYYYIICIATISWKVSHSA